MAEPVLEYTNLRPGDAQITRRTDENGITFVAAPGPRWRAALSVVVCGFVALWIVVGTVFIEEVDRWRDLGELVFPLGMITALAAVGVRSVRRVATPTRLRVDRSGAMLIEPDLLRMHKMRFERREVEFGIGMCGVDLSGRASYQLTIKKHGWLAGRPVFRGYAKPELEAVVEAATQVLDGVQKDRSSDPR